MSSEDTARQVAALREELLQAFERVTAPGELPANGRVRSSEITRALLAAVTKTGGEHSTIKIGRNASGQPTFEVSVRTGDTAAIASAADAAAEATRLYRELDELFPFVPKAGRE